MPGIDKQKRYRTDYQYANGASRVVHVVLTAITPLNLSDEEQLQILIRVSKEMATMHKRKDRDAPFIERAIKTVLASKAAIEAAKLVGA